MKHGLFVNTDKAQCSIYERGRDVFHCLRDGEWILDYVEIGQINLNDLYKGKITCENLLQNYDFYVFNYHPVTFKRVYNFDETQLHNILGSKINIIFEMEQSDDLLASHDIDINSFDSHMVLDPTFVSNNKKLISFPRPLGELFPITPITEIPTVPIIGSFGFPNFDKNFDLVIKQASIEFEKSIVRLHIPYATYMHSSLLDSIVESCKSIQVDNVSLEITHNFLNDNELINWCKMNHLNVFLYSRNMAGLAATPDVVIKSGSPLLTSNNRTFRHLFPYMKSFPEWSFKDAMLLSQEKIKIIRNDWSVKNFNKRFKDVLQCLG